MDLNVKGQTEGNLRSNTTLLTKNLWNSNDFI